MRWRKLRERSGLHGREGVPGGYFELYEQIVAAQQIEADRREPFPNLG